MRLSEIKSQPIHGKKRKRVGRGEASGTGKTAGRGHKGAKSRAGSGGKRNYEGGQMPLVRRLPKRGFSNFDFAVKWAYVNVEDLNRFESGAEVDEQALRDAGLLKKKNVSIRVLGRGKLKVALKVTADHFSSSAAEKIQKAGGEVRKT
jgi:large subunit ribosomal protein L15